MEQYVGLDVSLTTTWICVVDGAGKRLWKGTSASDPDAIITVLDKRAPHAARIGLETGPLSVWLTHILRGKGRPVVCLDARHAKAALSAQLNKTDADDAEGLAQIVRTGWYREVRVKSFETHYVRGLIGARAQLVNMRTELSNQIRGLLKIFGLIVGQAKGVRFAVRVAQIIDEKPQVKAMIDPILIVWRVVDAQLAYLTQRLGQYARESAVCRLLTTTPGVGPLTALAFITVVEDPSRFAKSRSVGAHLGLTPRRYQSGETDRMGRISKCGDTLARYYLFEAASVLLTRVRAWSSLKAWGMKLVKRIGAKKAKTAVARKLAVILHRMWVDSVPFRWADNLEAV